MDWSDRHCRFFWRLMSRHTRLYTEMITTGALRFGDRERFLKYHPSELPLALQLGGSDPDELLYCAQLAEEKGFSEVNLNCGCPSDRVQNGRIGACLMAEPELVAECLHKMLQSVSIPVTVKHRIGIDDQDEWHHLDRFVGLCREAGCRVFVIHARKAWLQGLSPKQNREVPPLNYERVFALKRAYPDLTVVLNGGVTDLTQTASLLENVDGVMMGRAAYHNPFLLAEVERALFADQSNPITREQVLQKFSEYCREEIAQGAKFQQLSRHILGLYLNQPGGRKFRRVLSEGAHLAGADQALLGQALEAVNNSVPHH